MTTENRTWKRWKNIEHNIRSSDLYDTVELRAYRCRNDGYGELLAPFTHQLCGLLNINESTRLVDVGSGIGFVGIDIAALTLCTVTGIEVRPDLHSTSLQILDKVSRLNLNVSFCLGDATSDDFSFKDCDVVLCCNTLWSSENNYKLLQKLCLELPEGAKVVVLEKLGGHRDRPGSNRSDKNILTSSFDLPEEFISPYNAVSWTNKPVYFYIYAKKNLPEHMAQDIIKERDALKVLEMQRKKIKAIELVKQAHHTQQLQLQKRKAAVLGSDKENASKKLKLRDATGRFTKAVSPDTSLLSRGKGRRKVLAVIQATSPDRPVRATRGLIAVATAPEPLAPVRTESTPAKSTTTNKRSSPPAKASSKSPKLATKQSPNSTPVPQEVETSKPSKQLSIKALKAKSRTANARAAQAKIRAARREAAAARAAKALARKKPHAPPQTSTASAPAPKTRDVSPHPPPPKPQPITKSSKLSSFASNITKQVSIAMKRISEVRKIVNSRRVREEQELLKIDATRGLRQRKFNSFLNDYIA